MENFAEIYNWLLISMSVGGLVVFIALYYVDAGYGILYNKKWGAPISNKQGWLIMEAAVSISMIILWACSGRTSDVVPLIFLILFQVHYIQRAFIFPFLLVGKSKMPVSIVAMGFSFNLINSVMQGGWLFYLSPEGYYGEGLSWLSTPQFIAGIALFLSGFTINLHSDYLIRKVRRINRGKEKRHFLPEGGVFNYVTSANYFGEIVEWTGFAILTWSLPGAVFAWWTIANLVPRAASTYKKYRVDYDPVIQEKNLKRVFPFIY
jgi:3-oxo-5-alpha-steroid 4-dehydrogenase 1